MGEVYAAEHVHIEKRFAIKLLRQEIVSNAEAVTRFRQEARSSSSIGHRNIIAIEDFGQLADGRIYMCMELLGGSALNDLLTQPMAVDRLLNIMIQTGHGLAAAHAKNIVHRDMKPENIFVTVGPNGEDIPKILDFGIAKVAGSEGQNHLTRTGMIFGTPFYMAPEQALGNPVDQRTDIYAVGVIMYECFAGSLPFLGESFMGILTQHITTDPEPVAQRAARAGRVLPGGLAEVITRCLQKNPAQRFSSMDELVNVLIQIYRSIVGPGMSTYMQAFPVPPTSSHQVQSTPVPRTGPIAVPITGPYAASGPAASPTGPILAASSSGVYTGAPAQKSKTGLFVAIVAVLLVGGGIAALAVTGGKRGGGTGAGSGSQVAAAGSSQGASAAGHPGSAGSATAAGSAAAHDGAGSGPAGGDRGDRGDRGDPGQRGSAGESAEIPDRGSNAPPPAEVVLVPLFARSTATFEVYENGAKLFDGPDNLEVPKGGERTVVIRARGFKDKTLVVQGVKKRVQFSLDRLPSSGAGPSHDHDRDPASPIPRPEPPQAPNCASALVDPKNQACVTQYCAAHPNDFVKCLE